MPYIAYLFHLLIIPTRATGNPESEAALPYQQIYLETILGNNLLLVRQPSPGIDRPRGESIRPSVVFHPTRYLPDAGHEGLKVSNFLVTRDYRDRTLTVTGL